MKYFIRFICFFALCVFLAPLFYAIALSISPSKFLEMPGPDWSGQWYSEFFSDSRWVSALFMSSRVALGSALLSVLLSLMSAIALRDMRPQLYKFFKFICLLPLFIPGTVLAVGLLPVFQKMNLYGEVSSLVLAHTLVGFPVSLVVVESALRKINPDFKLVSKSLGAKSWQNFCFVTLPLLRPSLLVAGLFSFILSMNDYIFATFLATSDIVTLPKVIWPSLAYTLTPVVAAASALSLVSSLIVGIIIILIVERDVILKAIVVKGPKAPLT